MPRENEACPLCCFITIIILIYSISYIFQENVVVNLGDFSDKTEEIFTNLHYENLPAYSKFIEIRVATAKLINMANTDSKNSYSNLVLFNLRLDEISKDLELIYEKGNNFFINFEKSIEKLVTSNEYSPTLFESMRNSTIEFRDTLSKANMTAHHPEQSEKFNEFNLRCDTSIIDECNYESSRVHKIQEFLVSSIVDLHDISFRLWLYSYINLDNIIKELSSKNVLVVSNAQTTRKLLSLVKIIKSSHMRFLMNQDVPKLSSPNNCNLDITENAGSKVYKSDLVGEAVCQEFVTYFSNPPAFQVAHAIKSKSSPFIRSIKVSAGEYIDSLTFEWSDNMSFKFGGNGGNLNNIDLEKGEVVSWIKIYKYKEGKICGLEFRTNKWRSTSILGSKLNIPQFLKHRVDMR